MAVSELVVYHTGTDSSSNTVGSVYLKDVGKRNQLGGSLGIYTQGQDQYISADQSVTLIPTGEVLMSQASGVIKTYKDLGVFNTSGGLS